MKRVAAVVLCAALAGCAARSGPLEEVQDVIADFVLPLQQAASLGTQLARKVEAERELHPSEALQRRVSRIGQRIVSAAGDVPRAYDFSFKVLQDPQTVNAFAFPGGRIYVTSGLVHAVGSDAQLASVLAHEVAHVTERHVADCLAASYGSELLASVALGQDAGGLARLAGGLLQQQQGALLKYSRTQELQADGVGLDYLRRAGYDPHAALAMFRKLEAGGASAAPVFLSSHPAMGERIEQALAQ